jgi:hypothetical protein
MSRRSHFCFSNRNRPGPCSSLSAGRRSSGRAAQVSRRRILERLEQRLVFSAVPLIPAELGDNVVFSSADQWELRGLSDRHTEIAHSDALELGNGTIGIVFTADSIDGRQALFSKDARNFGDGGHLTAMVQGDRVEVRLQSVDRSVTVRSDSGSVIPGETYQMWVTFGEQGLKLFLDGSLVDAEPGFTQGLVDNEENLAIGANIWARSDRDPDWVGDHFQGQLSNFVVYGRALTRAEVALIAGQVPAEPQLTAGHSESGLDGLVDLILADPGLRRRIAADEIAAGARAADEMNRLIVDAIKGTGVANDGTLSAADVRDVNAYLRSNHLARWTELHGDDDGDYESGFHLVQGDGATTHLFGDENAINTVADGIYHLGFGTSRGRLLNEDGNRNASMEDVAYWLNELLAEDLLAGTLVNEALLPSEQDIADAVVMEVDEIIDFRDTITHVELAHQQAFELSQGTIALSFTTDSVDDRQTLFSKDHRGYQQGGHVTAFIRDGRLEVRMQSDSQSKVITSAAGSIVAGQEHAVAVSFGDENGFRVFLDGKLVGEESEFTVGLTLNTNSIVLGASTTHRCGESLNLRDHFVGVIQDFAVYASESEIAEVVTPSPGFDPSVVDSVLEDVMNG